MRKIEVLAPVGNFECLKAAILAGCDAVYLGGYQFGARSFAGNFSNEELKKAVTYAHLYDVSVYVTVNTLIYENEVPTFLNYIDYLVSIHVDALIIQDLGMLDLVSKRYPDLELHASTQMHIHNLEGVKQAQKLGVSRVVLARETEIDVIQKIRANTSLELEIFVHGALCVSYSGQCLMSSLIGGRSGNRGTCAGSCRQKYQLVKNDSKLTPITDMEYLLSMKDLNTLDHLEKLLEVGVDSLKIEGRMKRPSYVYAVVSLYKKAVLEWQKTGKIHISKTEVKRLKKIFDRGSTKGFLFHEENDNITNSFRPNHLGVEVGTVLACKNNIATVKLTDSISIHDGLRFLSKEDVGTVLNVFRKNGNIVKEAYPNDIVTIPLTAPVLPHSKVVKTTDYKDQLEIQKEIDANARKVLIDGVLETTPLKPMRLTLKKDDITVTVVSDTVVEVASTKPVTKEKQMEQLKKLGNTVYQFRNLKVIGGDQVFIPLRALNELRREAISKLTEKRLERPTIKRIENDARTHHLNINKEEPGFSIKTSQPELLKELKTIPFSTCYVPFQKACQNQIPYLLPVNQTYPAFEKTILIGDLGGTHYQNFMTDTGMNVTNSYTVHLLHSMGAKRVTLSYEMDDIQIKELITAYQERYHTLPNLELVIYGREEMMISKFNLPKKYHVTEDTLLKSSFGNLYPIQIVNDYMILYHDRKRKKLEFQKYFDMGISTLRFQVLDCQDVKEIQKLPIFGNQKED